MAPGEADDGQGDHPRLLRDARDEPRRPRIGGVSLLNVGASHLNSFYADLLENGRRDGDGGLSPTTVRRVHSTLHKAFADAVRWGRLNRNQADAADPPRNAKTEMSILEPSELRTFLESVRSDRLYAAWVLATTTGMRRGEIVGLRWADIDLDARTLSISQIRTVANYQVMTLSPKTEKGARTISLDEQTVAALRAHRVAQMEEKLLIGPAYHDEGDFVFRDRTPNRSTPSGSRGGSSSTAAGPDYRGCASTTSGTRTAPPCSGTASR